MLNKEKYIDEIMEINLKASWATGTDEEIVAMVEAADRGEIDLSDYWSVGDIRLVTLNNGEGVELVIMHAGLYELNAPVASGRTTCSFIVGLKDCLATRREMNSNGRNSGSWNGSEGRTYCNGDFKNLIPTTLLPIFKQFKTITAATFNGTTNQESIDWFALPAAKEVFGGATATSAGSSTTYYSNLTEFNALTQFDWYKNADNRIKTVGGSTNWWWLRSPYCSLSDIFCVVGYDGRAYMDFADDSDGWAPFGCI